MSGNILYVYTHTHIHTHTQVFRRNKRIHELLRDGKSPCPQSGSLWSSSSQMSAESATPRGLVETRSFSFSRRVAGLKKFLLFLTSSRVKLLLQGHHTLKSTDTGWGQPFGQNHRCGLSGVKCGSWQQLLQLGPPSSCIQIWPLNVCGIRLLNWVAQEAKEETYLSLVYVHWRWSIKLHSWFRRWLVWDVE